MDALPKLNCLRPVKPLSDEDRALGKQQRAQTSVRSETEARIARISVALEGINQVLAADSPDIELNALARATKPRTNETRYRFWFYLQIAYDFSFWSVMPCRLEYGSWKRTDPVYKDSLFGRNRIHNGGTPRCWTPKELIDKMEQGFKRHAEEGLTWTAVWSKTIRLDLGGRIELVEVRLPSGRVRRVPAAFHANGDPLPSLGKFRYHVTARLGANYVAQRLKSKLRVEMQDQPVIGTQYGHLQFLGQQASFDSRQVQERPKAYLGNYNLPPMMIVDVVDGASGRLVGLGPCLGAEDSEGYKLALFCAAIDKPVFGKIVGIPISEEQWRGKGLYRALYSDRGPGCSEMVRAAVAPWHISIELARSYTPKDDALVEAKHPRKKKLLGSPKIVLSDLTVGEILKREIQRAIAKNHSDDALSRASDKAVMEDGASTPELLYASLESFQNSLIEISFSDAVRQFLRMIEFEVLRDGRLRYRGKIYDSQEAHSCGLASMLWKIKGKGLKVPGYLYWPATRFMWVAYKRQIVWVEKQSADCVDVKSCSDQELEAIQKERSRLSGERQQMKPYHHALADQIIKDEIGKEGNAGRRASPRTKVSKAALDEAQRIKGLR